MKHICHEPTVGTLNRRCSWARSLPRGMRRELRARSLRRAGIMEANEQVIFPPLPRHHYPAAAHPLPDLPPHRGVPARQPQLGPDRALPPGPSRSAQPSFPVASAGSPLPRRYRHRHRLPPDDLARAGRVSASAVTECGHPREGPRAEPLCSPAVILKCAASGAQNWQSVAMESGELTCPVSTPDVVVRDYASADYSACRLLWVELTEHHRRIYEDPFIGGDAPG